MHFVEWAVADGFYCQRIVWSVLRNKEYTSYAQDAAKFNLAMAHVRHSPGMKHAGRNCDIENSRPGMGFSFRRTAQIGPRRESDIAHFDAPGRNVETGEPHAGLFSDEWDRRSNAGAKIKD